MLRTLILTGLLATAPLAGAVHRPLPPIAAPDVVILPAGEHLYRPSAEFRIGTRQVDAPQERRTVGALAVMTRQVSQADYGRCVAEAACPALPDLPGAALPRTGVNWSDAVAYARWLSRRTGADWRLPTDEEWLRAAAERGFDGALGAEGADPSERWLASYRAEVARRGAADPRPRPAGHFGANAWGVEDMGGNVWEWTATCNERVELRPDGTILGTDTFCGVRVAQGRHRAFVIDFVRDARSGGCAAGIPPDFLGFRLVRDGA